MFLTFILSNFFISFWIDLFSN